MRIPALPLLSVVLFTSRAALACSCIPPAADPEEAVNNAVNYADIVFLGTVERAVFTGSGDEDRGAEMQESTFYILESWKGEKVSRISTRINIQCCMCGFFFEEGETYLVFGYEGKDGFYRTSICTLTRHADRADEYIDILRKLKAGE